MAFSGHEDQLMHVRRGLAEINRLHAMYGSTYQASSATIAAWQDVNTTKRNDRALTHEDQDMLVRRANPYTGNHLNPAGIYSNTMIAASNTTALAEAQFTSQDGSLPAAYLGSGLGDD